jgi:hypothetical protein
MRRHVVWPGIVSLAFQTDVHGSQSRAKNTALDTGLENWQNSYFLWEKVTRKAKMLSFHRDPAFRRFPSLVAMKNHLNMNI